jgi:two-component system chemotaxis sensor kinase CheA
VRAFVVVKRAESLGRVLAVVPPVEALQAEQFDREFAIRLETDAPPATIVSTLRAAGDVERVDIEDPKARAAAQSAEAGRSKASRNVRIDLRRLDALMNLIGELVITRGRLVQLAITRDDSALTEAVTEASRLVSDLQDQIMASRMVPVWQVFDRFPRLVRDSARALGKEIEFTIEGKDIELDRSMLDEIGEPVVHLLRNAVDHGFETTAERIAAGKPAAGKLVLSAARERSSITVRVTDDGRGIDRDRVLRKARNLGLVDAARSELSDDDLIRIISRPGFSTAERVTDISGRGVGIDAVHARIRSLGGSVEIRSVPGRGTTVTLRLPLTLAILRALLVRVDGDTFAVPMTHVNETVELEGSALKSVKGHEVLMLRDDVLPLVRFRSLLGLAADGARMPQVIVLEVGERRAGLVVDELAGQQDIVVKQFDTVRNAAALFSGATILGDGAPALIVDVGSLL